MSHLFITGCYGAGAKEWKSRVKPLTKKWPHIFELAFSDVPSFLILKVASVRFKTHFLKYSSCPILNISGQALLSKSPDVATLVNEGRPQ